MHYLGIEIGGTKLQLGIGQGNGVLDGLWRGSVDVGAGPVGIRRQIVAAVPELLGRSAIGAQQIKAVGIGFGGPVDVGLQRIIRSHQIQGWDDFPLAAWVSDLLGHPAVIGNDADVAGLAEAMYGAGRGVSPVFYMTIGSGIGGGLIVDGKIYAGAGRGAAEMGHLMITQECDGVWRRDVLEHWASGWAIQRHARERLLAGADSMLRELPKPERLTTQDVARAADADDSLALAVLHQAQSALADAICQVIVLLCPRRIVLGGGVALLGEKLLIAPLRQMVNQRVFRPFLGLTDIVPAELGEAMVVHGAIALAKGQNQ